MKALLFYAVCLAFLCISRGQSVCDGVVDNTVVVNAASLDRAASLDASLQDLVECLTEGGTINFSEDYAADDALKLNRDIRITAEEDVGITCNEGPILIVRNAVVDLSGVTVRGCRLDTEGAPLEVREGGTLRVRDALFEDNVNDQDAAVFLVGGGSELVLSDVKFRNNRGGSASVVDARRATKIIMTDVEVKDCHGGGSGVRLSNAEELIVVESRFENVTADQTSGGAIFCEGEETLTTVRMESTVFVNNRATNRMKGEGGAIAFLGNFSAELDDTQFLSNWAARRGGGIYAKGTPGIAVRNAFFVENESNFTGGGGIFAENDTLGILTVEVSNTVFTRNRASQYLGSGGGLRLQGEDVTCSLSDTVAFVSNVAQLDGGGIYAAHGTRLSVTDASFVGNEVIRGGGPALFAVSIQGMGTRTMSVAVARSKFLFNRAMYSTRGGGTVGATGFGLEFSIEDSLFSNNDAGIGSGGAVYVFSGPIISITTSTFTKNRATGGGALYGENDAKYTISGCSFEDNSAYEGGAIYTQGDVDLEIKESNFSRNAVITDGGAIKVLNFKSGGDEVARFICHNNTFIENQAGASLFDDALYGTQTTGGGVMATGNGVMVEILRCDFERNEASEGGGVHVRAVAESNFSDANTFVNNTAARGGGVFILVDERIRPMKEFYFIHDSVFTINTANSGGGIYVASNKFSNEDQSPNARVFRLQIKGCNIHNNRAYADGGGITATGAGVIVLESEFVDNRAQQPVGFDQSTSGGGILAEDGAGIQCKQSQFVNNSAKIGGALCIEDASVKASEVLFDGNRVSESGVGGAIAVELSREKDIPVINEQRRLRNIIYQCTDCSYNKNHGGLRGGAIHVHDLNPSGDLSFLRNCTAASLDAVDEEGQCTISYLEYLKRLGQRIIRLTNNNFTDNVAQIGGGIFTNNPSLINATIDDDDNGTMILEDEEFTTVNASILFFGNEIKEGGYGPDIATTPVEAFFQDGDSVKKEKTEKAFLTGDRLNFTVVFYDALMQKVSVDVKITATLVISDRSNKENLELSGQDTGRMNDEGDITITAARLRGKTGASYRLSVQYTAMPGLLTQQILPSNITVKMRPCKFGEEKKFDEVAGVDECNNCTQGTFRGENLTECRSCANTPDATCFGDAIVPNIGYWHMSSVSFKMYRCIGHESCRFDRRQTKIKEEAKRAHNNSDVLDYVRNKTTLQCREGYMGPLCGSCESGWGREGGRCRKCGAAAVRGLLLFVLLLWALAFLSYFIRSVLQLSSRIEFNRRFNQAPTDAQKRFMETINGPASPQGPPREEGTSEIAPESSIAPLEIEGMPPASKKDLARLAANQLQLERLKELRPGTQAEAEVPSPARSESKPRGRLVRMIMAATGQSTSDQIEPLTLANPVSEILKILVNFLQVTSVAASINVDWTDSLRRTLYVAGNVGAVSTGSGYLSLDCSMTEKDTPKSLRRMVFMILFPMFMFIFYFIFWIIYTLMRRRSSKYFYQRVWLTYLAINYFVYIGLTKNLLRFFACADVKVMTDDGDDSQLVWEEDSTVECFSKRHGIIIGFLVIPLLFVISIGFPVGTFVVLYKNKDRLNDDDFIETYGFLYRAYDIHYWEVVVMCRKLAIAIVAVFAYVLGSNIQGLMCALVMVVALGLQLTFDPFTHDIPRLNQLETCSLCATVLVFVAGLLQNDERTSSNTRTFLGVGAIIVILVTVIVIVAGLMLASEEVVDMKLIETEAMELSDIVHARLGKKLETLTTHYFNIASTIGNRIYKVFKDRVVKGQNREGMSRVISGNSDAAITP